MMVGAVQLRRDGLNVGRHENADTTEAIERMRDALAALDRRTSERAARGVEGTSTP